VKIESGQSYRDATERGNPEMATTTKRAAVKTVVSVEKDLKVQGSFLITSWIGPYE
jgi:hypothetical protein